MRSSRCCRCPNLCFPRPRRFGRFFLRSIDAAQSRRELSGERGGGRQQNILLPPNTSVHTPSSRHHLCASCLGMFPWSTPYLLTGLQLRVWLFLLLLSMASETCESCVVSLYPSNIEQHQPAPGAGKKKPARYLGMNVYRILGLFSRNDSTAVLVEPVLGINS